MDTSASPTPEIDVEGDVDAGQVHLAGTGGADAVDAHGIAVERHRDSVRVELDRSDTDGGEHAAPVGVGSEQRGLDEAVAGDGAGADERVVLRTRHRAR